MNEFEMIWACFKPLTMDREEARDLRDDAAVISVPDGFDLVVSSDTLNEDVHFHADAEASYVAKKALRANISDMAAMGAKPYCYQLNISFDQAPEQDWVAEFADALLEDQKKYDVFCSGGDTTVTSGVLTITITMMGLVPKGKAVSRHGAQVGDTIVVTDVVGCGTATQYRALPRPNTGIAEAVHTHAGAAIDISDGLIADLSHICTASGVGARIEASEVILCDGAEALMEKGDLDLEDFLSGGEDYVLVLAVPVDSLDAFMDDVKAQDVKPHIIGRIESEPGVRVVNSEGEELSFERAGWKHF